jgi:hypothetical protein
MKRRDFITTTLAGAALSAVGVGCKPRHNVLANECATPECEPFACHYARMFPHLARRPSTPGSTLESGLAELGAKMTDLDQGNDGILEAGYTYFGQIIDHDLTLDITPLDFAHPHPERIQNHRTPFLDLDNVYGGGPTVSPYLYEMNGPPGNEKFVIGRTAGEPCSCDDLPRNAQGIALVVDPRQDENLLVAQLHVAFLKFHNSVMDKLGTSEEVQSVGPAGGTRFQQARRFVTWHYQYAVVHDFVRLFLDDDLSKDVAIKCSESPIKKPPTFRIPIEFSAAAFRFGHSMARDTYGIVNENHENVDLGCLLALTGAGGHRNIPCNDPQQRSVPFALPAHWKVHWPHFFFMPSHNQVLNHIRKIDTGVARALHDLRIEDVNKFSTAVVVDSQKFTSPKNILPVRTLWRGARMGLPSGQDVAEALGIKNPITEDEIKNSSDPETKKILLDYRFHQDTPLWYYILKEAEIRGRGNKLGPVGGRIVADVIVAALRSDPNSYLSVDPKWKPTIWGIPPGKISDILFFVADHE